MTPLAFAWLVAAIWAAVSFVASLRLNDRLGVALAGAGVLTCLVCMGAAL